MFKIIFLIFNFFNLNVGLMTIPMGLCQACFSLLCPADSVDPGPGQNEVVVKRPETLENSNGLLNPTNGLKKNKKNKKTD